MPKNIVICCDGTGNEVKKGAISNVLELYLRLDKRDPARQVVYYDPGLGILPAAGVQTRTAKAITRLLGLAFAYGLTANIREAYTFLMRNYAEGDRIFLYGFSRGAYTVRALAGLVFMCGLLDPNCDNLVDYAIHLHRSREHGEPPWKKAARFRKYFPRQWPTERGEGRIHFLGVWDTVKSVGLFRRSLVLPYTARLEAVSHGRHALAIHERRTKFPPNVWSPGNADEISPLTGEPRFRQVWFAGVHSDVGGGYEENGLSDIALQWMLRESERHGLLVDPAAEVRTLAPDPMGELHNSLIPIWWLLGWRRRRAARPVLAHVSVRARRERDARFDRTCAAVLGDDVTYVS